MLPASMAMGKIVQVMSWDKIGWTKRSFVSCITTLLHLAFAVSDIRFR